MSRASATQKILGAKKNHSCSWCAERINLGTPYERYRYYNNDNEAGTVKLHPECSEVLDEMAKDEGGWYEFYPGENPRGCSCGHSHGCPTCEEIQAKIC